MSPPEAKLALLQSPRVPRMPRLMEHQSASCARIAHFTSVLSYTQNCSCPEGKASAPEQGQEASPGQRDFGGRAPGLRAVAKQTVGTDARLSHFDTGTDARLSQFDNWTDARLSFFDIRTDARLSHFPNWTDARLSHFPNGTDARLSHFDTGTDGSRQQWGLKQDCHTLIPGLTEADNSGD